MHAFTRAQVQLSLPWSDIMEKKREVFNIMLNKSVEQELNLSRS